VPNAPRQWLVLVVLGTECQASSTTRRRRRRRRRATAWLAAIHRG
jgi:hypothetical protein